MARTEKVWHLLPSDPDATNRLAAAAKVSPVVAQLLLNRDILDPVAARRFLDCPLAGLHPPLALSGVADAAERIARAIADKRRICIYGDYDVDGVTGTAILMRLLGKLGADVTYYTPDRLADGYGLHTRRLHDLAQSGVSLVISVDCGIASVVEANEARAVGLELIVTDHHEMKVGLDGPMLPDAAVIVHPRLPGGSYPFGDLCGAGVAFKLGWALAQRCCGSERVPPELRELLLDGVGLAALGLVADVVPLRDENRIFVKHGLDRIRTHPSIGLKALMEAAGINPDEAITSEDVGFKLAPRLNAAGRLGCARIAVDLLTTNSLSTAKTAAEFLEGQNSQRQAMERKYTQQAKEMVDVHFPNDPAVVVGSHDWKAGVVGIVASRLVDHYGKPALVIAMPENRDKDSMATGSGRSIPGFPLHIALRSLDELLEGHGGHAAAAGFKIRPDRIPAFRDRFNAYVTKHFPGGTPAPRLVLDAEVPLSALTFGLLRDLDKLEPYGAGNPRPRFLAAGLKAEGARLIGTGETKKHLDFRVRQGETTMRCVAWNMSDRMEELLSADGDCCLAFTPKVNEWRGNRKIELQVTDLKPGKTVALG
ncbi:MAG: single-stranded-DNA-specific exonuclease RecJ [Gemmataceae bacterium]